MLLELLDNQNCPVSVSAVDAKGAPATVQDPVWSSSDATAASVTADPADPLKAVISAGLPGVARISCKADADLGDGVKPIEAVLDVSVIGGEATGFNIVAGTPIQQ